MIEFGLERISRLLARSPLPWRAIHVAGTNGKGSICAYISAMLETYNNSAWRQSNSNMAKCVTHGRFTSPHLIDRWDCITINQKAIPLSVFQRVEKRVLDRNRKEDIGASEFELLAATAFEIFTDEAVDVAVVEVGMGGRLDATNVIGQTHGLAIPKGFDRERFRPKPLVTAISSIGFDHQAFLGSNLRDIAKEKAGIMKNKVPLVLHESNTKDVMEVLSRVAKNEESPVICLDSPELHVLDVGKIKEQLYKIPPGHIRGNAKVAFLAAWVALSHLGLFDADATSASSEDLRNRHKLLTDLAVEMLNVVGETSLSGRQQKLGIEKLTGRSEDILLDGAHNEQSALALASAVSELRKRHSTKDGEQQVTWVLAASDTKDAKEILMPLLKGGDAVFAVEFGPVDGMPWVKPMSTEKLLQVAKEAIPKSESLSLQGCGKNLLDALKKASIEADGGLLVVAGSLYLVGDVLRLLRDYNDGLSSS